MIEVSGLMSLLVTLIIAGLIFYLLWWLVGVAGVPEPFNRVIRVVLALVVVIYLINVLLGLSGTRLFR